MNTYGGVPPTSAVFVADAPGDGQASTAYPEALPMTACMAACLSTSADATTVATAISQARTTTSSSAGGRSAMLVRRSAPDAFSTAADCSCAALACSMYGWAARTTEKAGAVAGPVDRLARPGQLPGRQFRYIHDRETCWPVPERRKESDQPGACLTCRSTPGCGSSGSCGTRKPPHGCEFFLPPQSQLSHSMPVVQHERLCR
jgi:hypothetical protein